MSCFRYQMENPENTTRVMISWIVLSCAALNVWLPMRLAGTWKQYSKKAMPQLIIVTFHNGTFWYLRCPYHAKVIKILEISSRRMVIMSVFCPGSGAWRAFPDCRGSRNCSPKQNRSGGIPERFVF